ncbi:MAG: hypothetical protein IJW23_14350 [Lentisphaeria bacterium]|nr:hypothetical protein [Lentisphaeria bacterium]
MAKCWRCGREYNTWGSLYCPDCELLKQQEEAAAEAREREKRDREAREWAAREEKWERDRIEADRKAREEAALEEQRRMADERERNDRARHNELMAAEQKRIEATEQLRQEQAERHQILLAQKEKEDEQKRQAEAYTEASPRCKWCGKKYTFKDDGFFEYCSRKCAKEDLGKENLEQYSIDGEEHLRNLFSEAVRQKNGLRAYILSEGISHLTADEKCRFGYLLEKQNIRNEAIPKTLSVDLLLDAVSEGNAKAAEHWLNFFPDAVSRLHETILTSDASSNADLQEVIRKSLTSRSHISAYQKILEKYRSELPAETAEALSGIAQSELFAVNAEDCENIRKALLKTKDYPSLYKLQKKLEPILKDKHPGSSELLEDLKKKSEQTLCDIVSETEAKCTSFEDYNLLYTVCSGGNYGDLIAAAEKITKEKYKTASADKTLPLIFSQQMALRDSCNAKAVECLKNDAAAADSYLAFYKLQKKLEPIISERYPKCRELADELQHKAEAAVLEYFSKIAGKCKTADDYILLSTVCSKGNYGDLSAAAKKITNENEKSKLNASDRKIPLIFSKKKKLALTYQVKAAEILVPDAQKKIDSASTYQDYIEVQALCEKLITLEIENAQDMADFAKKKAAEIKKNLKESAAALPLNPETISELSHAKELYQRLVECDDKSASKKVSQYQQKIDVWNQKAKTSMTLFTFYFLFSFFIFLAVLFPSAILIVHWDEWNMTSGAVPGFVVFGTILLLALCAVATCVWRLRRLGLYHPFYNLNCYLTKKSPEEYK